MSRPSWIAEIAHLSRRPTVLVIDDDRLTLALVAREMRAEGFDVIVESDPKRACARAATSRVDAVLLDLEMPEASGFDVLAELRSMSATRELPVIIYSGRDGAEYVAKAASLGASEYLTKPMTPGTLGTAVRSELAGSAI